MKSDLSKRLSAAFLLSIFVLGGCAQTVRISTEPEGADVYVNNIFVGESPTQYRTKTGTPDTSYVRIEKRGYKDVKNATIDREYRANIMLLWLIPGIFPYFFAGAQYDDDYLFYLKKK